MQHYDQAVFFIGPTNGGKTRLFFALTENRTDVPTLTSLAPNLKVVVANNGERSILYVDVPGHQTLAEAAVLNTALQKKKPSKIVFVLDATQPVRAAADKLCELLEYMATTKATTTTTKQNQEPTIFIACHQSDRPKCKTVRRVQLQLRSELEKLHNQETTWWTGQFDDNMILFGTSSVYDTQAIQTFVES